jgi:hypothetical protein
VGKPSLEKGCDSIEVFGRALHFGLDLLSKGTVRVCKIVYVNGHLMTCLSRSLRESSQAAEGLQLRSVLSKLKCPVLVASEMSGC